ncbi:MAG TPA: hypothetical protein VML57_05970 [Burkholderiales bacterium]|nr:hypothetical protein [Burkholderiales bacterium]
MSQPALERARSMLDSAKAPDARRAAREFVAQAGRDAAALARKGAIQ